MIRFSSKALNAGERFCCSKRSVKEVFGDSEISVWFANYRRDYLSTFARCDYEAAQKKLKGKVIADLQISHTSGVDCALKISNTILSFYVLKEEEFSEELEKEFATKVLPKMYARYIAHKDCLPGNVAGVYYFRVELYDNSFIMQDGIKSRSSKF